jgi:MerR family transcriptional regulator/heat shock protein HspR
MISVAAELSGMHPQTLRIYERRELIKPKRSSGNTRLYSDADIEQLRLIQELTSEGINLAGVIRILELQAEVDRFRSEVDRLRRQAEDAHRRAEVHAAGTGSGYRAELVMVRRGGLARRDG